MGQINLNAALGYSCLSSFKIDVRSHYAPLQKQVAGMTVVSKPQTQLHASVQKKSLKNPVQKWVECFCCFKQEINTSEKKLRLYM